MASTVNIIPVVVSFITEVLEFRHTTVFSPVMLSRRQRVRYSKGAGQKIHVQLKCADPTQVHPTARVHGAYRMQGTMRRESRKSENGSCSPHPGWRYRGQIWLRLRLDLAARETAPIRNSAHLPGRLSNRGMQYVLRDDQVQITSALKLRKTTLGVKMMLSVGLRTSLGHSWKSS